MTRKLIAFGWYGGKYSHLEWLLGLLPEAHHLIRDCLRSPSLTYHKAWAELLKQA